MKNPISVLLLTTALCGTASWAAAQPTEPSVEPTPTRDGSAGAADQALSDERYLPGPGGGDPEPLEPGGPPPLQSTGLEDGIGGCKCATRLGTASTASAWCSLFAGLMLLRRRSSRPIR